MVGVPMPRFPSAFVDMVIPVELLPLPEFPNGPVVPTELMMVPVVLSLPVLLEVALETPVELAVETPVEDPSLPSVAFSTDPFTEPPHAAQMGAIPSAVKSN
jgi:hypothetical protein